MRDRGEKLEKMVSQILQRLDSKQASMTIAESDMSAVEALKTLETGLSPSSSGASDELIQSSEYDITQSHEKTVISSSAHRFDRAPLLSLFDNSVLRHETDTGPDIWDHIESSPVEAGIQRSPPHFEKQSRIFMAVKALIPNDDELTHIIQLSLGCWQEWQNRFPDMLGPRISQSEDDQITHIRLHIRQCLNSGDVGGTAKILVCMATCYQQHAGRLSPGQWSLPIKPIVLQKRYMAFVESLLASDEGLASTIDGLECMVLQIRFYVDEGQPRKAWLVNRRATGLAYCLGIHRPARNTNDLQAQRKANLWFDMSYRERHLALVLGLPYSTLDYHFNAKDFTSEEESGLYGERLIAKLSVIAGHIIDRNSDLKSTSLIDTLKIDQELEEARNSMPSGWWEAVAVPSMPAEVVRDMFVAKVMYHNDRKLLHLPYLLKSFTDRRYELSRICALESSREMMKCYLILRREDALLVCNLLDFQVFTASMVLVLDLCNQYNNNRSGRDLVQEDNDWNLVCSIKEEFNTLAKTAMCPVAVQAGQVLQQFSDARYGCDEITDETYQVTIPYFGKIRIGKANTTTPSSCSRSTTSLTSQQRTPEASNNEGLQFGADTFIPFDNCNFPISDDSYLEIGTDWASMFDLDLQNDWSHPLERPT